MHGSVTYKRFIIALAVGVALLAPEGAAADVAQSIQGELQVAGVPGASVGVTTPSAASAADLTAYRNDASQVGTSLSPENLISPDPTIPLPVVAVGIGAQGQTPLTGLLVPPSEAAFTPAREDAQTGEWQLDAMLALKHAVASGASLAGLSITKAPATSPEIYLTGPEPDTYPPVVNPTLSMTTDQVQAAIQQGLPAWARGATISVFDFTGGERRAIATLPLPSSALQAVRPGGLVSYLLSEQTQLNGQGAGLGSVLVRLQDSVSGDPLFSYAGDASWGQNFVWASPLVSGIIDPTPSAYPADPTNDGPTAATDAAGAVVAGAKGAAGIG